ncbi:DUF4157 domain-containing protein [uncultured Thalassolituus sp.]|nr:DUF4157 domain-containing protein [uncultured Thalassolituus sp.]
MQVSDPGDSEEKEADRVAADVKRNISSGNNQIATAARSVGSTGAGIKRAGEEEAQAKLYRQEEEEAVQTKLFRAEEEEAQTKLYRQEEEEAIQTKLFRAEEEEAQTKLYRQEEEEAVQTKLFRAEEEEAQTKLYRQEEEEAVQTKAWRSEAKQESENNESELDAVEARIAQTRGNGQQLPEKIRNQMEQQFGRDFSGVVIHSDMQADELCKELNARAFAIGNDIYFANGEFNPDSERGQELIAHELTHVVQQGKSVTRKIYRNSQSTGNRQSTGNQYTVSAGTFAGAVIDQTPGAKKLSIPKLNVPALKNRNSSLFGTTVNIRKGRRPRTTQTTKFREAVATSATSRLNTMTTQASQAGAAETDQATGETFYFFKHSDNSQMLLFGKPEDIKTRLEIPIWDDSGQGTNFQVDHILEMQLNGEDDKDNYELLEGDANMGAGRAIAAEIREKIKGTLGALTTEYPNASLPTESNWSKVKRSHQVSFGGLDWTLPHDGSANGSRYWSLSDITTGKHVQKLQPMTQAERQQVGAGGPPIIYPSEQGGTPLPDISTPKDNWIPRVDLINWAPLQTVTNGNLGTLTISAFKAKTAANRQVGTPPDYPNQDWNVKKLPGMNAGYIESSSYTRGIRNSLRLPGMSPIELDSLTLSSAGFEADGRVLPTVPLISQADVRIRISGTEVQVYKTFSLEELNVPSPFTVDNCDLTVFFSTERGLGIEGRADFSVDKVGSGYLGAAASTQGGFALEGGFDFDSKLFDRASIELWYKEDQLGGRGEIGIDNPGKIKGIRAANLSMEYKEGDFSAEGTVDPDIPGVQQAGLTVDYSEEEGLTIGGSLQLSANPAIRSGSIEVKVNKQGEEWKVSGEGTAQPAIPGIDSELTVGYEDGGFKAEFSGAFQRGMLSGRVMVGISNRAVGEDGQPSGDPLPGGELLVYGSGSATIQIAPWLQGTAGVRFDPDGEVTVSGEIGIPDELEIFARKEINKSIFSIAVQAPIIPGIVAEVGGGLSATAGIGPGVIDELRIGIEYNPAREEDTKVTGDAHLKVPADAGLRLSVRAGIGLGITGASATGGLDIGGTLGISGAAEAGVHIDWTPATGLDLTANLSVYAQPSFTFDIGGYVSVRVFGFSVYDDRFQFASYTFGSDYRFGIKMPVHYHEGEPFDISTDDIEFEVPDINTNDLLKGLISRIT